jgi:hypothetical protein
VVARRIVVVMLARVLNEEEAEGGDVLAPLSRSSNEFLAGFERQCEGSGVALYRRIAAPLTN